MRNIKLTFLLLAIIIFSCNKKKDYILISEDKPIAHKTPTISSFSVSLSTNSPTSIDFQQFKITLVDSGYPKDASYSRILEYGIYWSKTNSTPTDSDYIIYWIPSTTSTSLITQSARSGLITNLDLDTKYYFRAYAKSKKGTGYSNTSIIYTNSNIKTIGSTFWNNLNLDVETYSDGTTIPEITSNTDWQTTKKGAWCYYDNVAGNNSSFGKLYNWYAVMGIYDSISLIDPSKRKTLAPKNYRIATTTDWNNAIINGIFTKINLPFGGKRNYSTGGFGNVGVDGNYWCKDNATDSSFFKFTQSTNLLISEKAQSKKQGYSVRCIREK